MRLERCFYGMAFAASMLLAMPVFAQKLSAPAVIVSIVKISPISDRVEALGTLQANESVEITATVTEKITALHFDDGQRVEQGDTLVEMTSSEEHALLRAARSTLNEARKQFTRYKELTATSAASKSVLDLRRRDMETAKARLNAIESRMSDRLLKAPFSGVVSLRNISVGALVEPGDIITTLYDDTMMKLDFSVPSTFLPVLKTGLPIIARARAFGDQQFHGTVSSIDPAINPITRSVQVRAVLPNEANLLNAGLLMSVELLKNPRKSITVPEEALVMKGDQHYLYVATEDLLADQRPVKIGTRFHGSVEILKGIEVGEKLITRGMMNLRPNQLVTIRGEDTGGDSLDSMLNGNAKGSTP
ncbi:MAG: efflux RND transporter periplasmic adaptor subunit [Rickettsiales bacterium]|nr:efflux RND transporter periplasmic adaptor subunit [Rickettsiales bacterium]